MAQRGRKRKVVELSDSSSNASGTDDKSEQVHRVVRRSGRLGSNTTSADTSVASSPQSITENENNHKPTLVKKKPGRKRKEPSLSSTDEDASAKVKTTSRRDSKTSIANSSLMSLSEAEEISDISATSTPSLASSPIDESTKTIKSKTPTTPNKVNSVKSGAYTHSKSKGEEQPKNPIVDKVKALSEVDYKIMNLTELASHSNEIEIVLKGKYEDLKQFLVKAEDEDQKFRKHNPSKKLEKSLISYTGKFLTRFESSLDDYNRLYLHAINVAKWVDNTLYKTN